MTSRIAAKIGAPAMGALLLVGLVVRGQETLQLVPQLAHSGTVRSVAYSRDGRFMLMGSMDGTARLWDAVTGKQIRRALQ